MIVKCGLCGGENKIHPGQKMLKCSYCGSALGVNKRNYPEHLILPHERNDKTAEDILLSFLLKHDMGRPSKLETDFCFVPYTMIEDEKGESGGYPARGAPAAASPIPDPPSGDYCYFTEDLASGEKIIKPKELDPEASKILHLPLYVISFRLGKKKWKAAVIGESWEIQIDRMPPQQSSSPDWHMIVTAGGLFALYLLIGSLGHSFMAKFVILFTASVIGSLTFKIRKKIVEQNEG